MFSPRTLVSTLTGDKTLAQKWLHSNASAARVKARPGGGKQGSCMHSQENGLRVGSKHKMSLPAAKLRGNSDKHSGKCSPPLLEELAEPQWDLANKSPQMPYMLPAEILDLIFVHVVASYNEPETEVLLADRTQGIQGEICIKSMSSASSQSGTFTGKDIVDLQLRGRLWHPLSFHEPLRVWSQINRHFRVLAIPHIFRHLTVERFPDYTSADPIWTGPYQGVDDYADHPLRQLRALRNTFHTHLHHVRSFCLHNVIPEMEIANMTGEDNNMSFISSDGLEPLYKSQLWEEYIENLVWLLSPGSALRNAHSLVFGTHMMCCSPVREAILARDQDDYISIDAGDARWDDPEYYRPFLQHFRQISFTQASGGFGFGYELDLFEALCQPTCNDLHSLTINFDISEVIEMLKSPEQALSVLQVCARTNIKVLLRVEHVQEAPTQAAFSFALGSLHRALESIQEEDVGGSVNSACKMVTVTDVHRVAKSKVMSPIAEYLRAHAGPIAAAFNERAVWLPTQHR